MNNIAAHLLFTLVLGYAAFPQNAPPPRAVDLRSPDETLLKATYYAAANPGPGVLLYHQSNRTRQSWDGVAAQLAAAGIHVLTVDSRVHGESGGRYDNEADRAAYWKTWWPSDLDAAFQYLRSRPGVNREVIGAGGAGNLGVQSAVETARRHPAEIKSLVLLSGETERPGMEFLHQAPQLPELFVADDNDEYPPTQEEMKLLYIFAASSSKRFVHYSQSEDAPWLWYETFLDSGKVPANGGHGTDLFKPHPELPGIIVHWFETTLLKTPGHAPADTEASAQILSQLEFGGAAGIAQVKQQLLEARKKDPHTQLFPEVTTDSIGEDYQRGGDVKSAIEIFKLNLLAYPGSADAHYNLAYAYLADGQKDLARQYAEKAWAMLDSHNMPLSSWSDTDPRRAEIRSGIEEVFKKASGPSAPASATTTRRQPGSVFRDCPDCPEMVVLPAGHFTMGSSAAEKSWAASHGGSAEAVADEAPQHEVSVSAFAIGKYDVTRADYAAFVRETGYPSGDGCGAGVGEWKKQPGVSWQKPGFQQTDLDPVVCVSWQDAQAYVAWLNRKLGRMSTAGEGLYRLPSEAEWEYAARGGTTTKFWWGEDVTGAPARAWFKENCVSLSECARSGGRTHPVGTKPPNDFGLYDMAGNVWQWTEDCYDNSYAGTPADGRANETPSSDAQAKDSQGNCLRVDRGSSYLFPAWLLRSGTRERNPADFRDVIMGFRVARTLP